MMMMMMMMMMMEHDAFGTPILSQQAAQKSIVRVFRAGRGKEIKIPAEAVGKAVQKLMPTIIGEKRKNQNSAATITATATCHVFALLFS